RVWVSFDPDELGGCAAGCDGEAGGANGGGGTIGAVFPAALRVWGHEGHQRHHRESLGSVVVPAGDGAVDRRGGSSAVRDVAGLWKLPGRRGQVRGDRRVDEPCEGAEREVLRL